ncbi:MAG: tetratricopeptide repeat protein [Tepidisphaeraceae bacterium]
MNDRPTTSPPSKPTASGDFYQQGLSLLEQRRFNEAAATLGRAYALLPNQPALGIKLGAALMHKGDAPQAVAILASIANQHPYLVEAHGMLANAHALCGQWEPAVASFHRALELAPNLAVAHFGLGAALAHQGKVKQSIAAFRAALRLNYPAAHCNLGVALALVGELDEAAAELRKAISFNPDDATAHWNYAILKLLQGEWRDGWLEYEWRWRWNLFPSARRNFGQPAWRGEDIEGRTLLLHAEQGFGDTIQFIRYLPLLASRGARVIVECQAELFDLFQQVPGPQQWVRAGEALPTFDAHCPLASLPGLFGTTPQSIPPQVPPLSAPPDRLAFWQAKLGPPDGRRRVGLAWAGRSTFLGDHTRSLHLSQLRGVLAIEGIQFYSLQKGPAAAQVKQLAAAQVIDLGSDFGDFADTAAVMSLCDLIVTTDTSVPHLAGAMGRPVWVMLQYVPDWRWLLNRDDSPWYPSARLFRQTSLGDWNGVISRVAQAITNP